MLGKHKNKCLLEVYFLDYTMENRRLRAIIIKKHIERVLRSKILENLCHYASFCWIPPQLRPKKKLS